MLALLRGGLSFYNSPAAHRTAAQHLQQVVSAVQVTSDFSDNLWLDPMDAGEDKRRAEARKPLNEVVRANSTGPQERAGRARPLYRALPELSSRSQSRDPTGGID